MNILYFNQTAYSPYYRKQSPTQYGSMTFTIQKRTRVWLTRILTGSYLYLIDMGYKGQVQDSPQSSFSLEFSARISRTYGQILLVDSREGENRQPASIGRQAEKVSSPLLFVDRRIIEKCQRISYPESRAYIYAKFLSLVSLTRQ